MKLNTLNRTSNSKMSHITLYSIYHTIPSYYCNLFCIYLFNSIKFREKCSHTLKKILKVQSEKKVSKSSII